MNDSTPPEGKRRFKETRALVRLALDDGMTQTEIARICRTQQSTVSMWANGERKAFENQIQPLLARYGRQLRRTSERVYLVEGPAWEGSELARMFADAQPEYQAQGARYQEARRILMALNDEAAKARAQAKEQARRLIEAEEKRLRAEAAAQGAKGAESQTRLRRPSVFDDDGGDDFQAEFEAAVEGQLEARQAAIAAMRAAESAMNECLQRLASVAGWDVRFEGRGIPDDLGLGYRKHLYGEGRSEYDWLLANVRARNEVNQRFLVAVEGPIVFRHVLAELFVIAPRQGPARLHGEPAARWLVHAQASGAFVLVRQLRHVLPQEYRQYWRPNAPNGTQLPESLLAHVHSHDDDARWLSTIEGPMDLEALLARADRFAVAPEGFATVHDQLTLPFRLRKALIEHGYPVPGLRRIGAS